MARQRILQAERKEAEGDPVNSRPTPFISSLQPNAPISAIQESYLNYFLKPEDVQKTLEHSKWLTEPLPETTQLVGAEERLAEKLQQHAASHENASRALLAIASLENASSKNRTQTNIQRCIEEFGRHRTDGVLAPGLQSKANIRNQVVDAEAVAVSKRIGADTGSSEVQIAILTAKINILANNLKANKDKSNKRRLRMMVHKRQKHMSYLRRQDRGGPRWQNVVDKLGLNDAMWRGEISL
ncbi:hypothetical protein H2200_001171 [Cladophialophora chaetospira]|uniref:Ribosomal protein S15 n=1 Tax=Cladophialophora chaetospira TaxID=386627 RepID=A0AA39CPC0_9EURO|nr:hypothetical protein H2200_001171 [Cladophialophora chaetospira]